MGVAGDPIDLLGVDFAALKGEATIPFDKVLTTPLFGFESLLSKSGFILKTLKNCCFVSFSESETDRK